MRQSAVLVPLSLLLLFTAQNNKTQHTSKFCFNPMTPRVKPQVIQSFLTFDSMDRTLKCDRKAVEQYFTVVLFVSAIFPSWLFQKLISVFIILLL